MSEQKVRTEEFQVSGDMLVAKIKELLHEGNIRRVIIKNEEGRTLIDVPLTLGANRQDICVYPLTEKYSPNIV